MEKTSSAKELAYTPEALRRSGSGSQPAPTRPGEKSPAKSKTPEPKSPSKPQSRLRVCGQSLAFVPWWALLSLALLVGGITLLSIKGKPAAAAARALWEEARSDSARGFPKYMDVYDTAVWVTVGVAGATLAALVLSAAVRLDQTLRKKGHYSTSKGPYGTFVYRFFTFIAWVGVLLAMLLAMWSTVAGMLLSNWAAQTWNLQEGCNVAGANIVALRNMGAQYTQTLDDFAAAVMGTATNETAPQLNATVVPAITSLKQFANNFSEASQPYLAIQQAQEGLCPSVACLNLAMYPFLESAACACTKAATESVHDLAKEASQTAVWAALAAAGLFCGALFGSMELAADAAMLRGDQTFLRVAKRKTSRPSSRSSSRRGEAVALQTPSPGTSLRSSFPPYSVHANASFN